MMTETKHVPISETLQKNNSKENLVDLENGDMWDHEMFRVHTVLKKRENQKCTWKICAITTVSLVVVAVIVIIISSSSS